ncbi:hypothetical protein [Ruegeria lacuscaerulensis]|uniref:hypothetical protein n=1 Tax=Ruegeria lacuscaerulensis TaxID=55218 RepID=UPI00147D720A|nr:hypothetical protein [Ruegeria lacuscaerulensis]
MRIVRKDAPGRGVTSRIDVVATHLKHGVWSMFFGPVWPDLCEATFFLRFTALMTCNAGLKEANLLTVQALLRFTKPTVALIGTMSSQICSVFITLAWNTCKVYKQWADIKVMF